MTTATTPTQVECRCPRCGVAEPECRCPDPWYCPRCHDDDPSGLCRCVERDL